MVRIPGASKDSESLSLTSWGAPKCWDTRAATLRSAGHTPECVKAIISAEWHFAHLYEQKAGWCQAYGDEAVHTLQMAGFQGNEHYLVVLRILYTAVMAQRPFEGEWTDVYFAARDELAGKVPGVEQFPDYEELIKIAEKI